MGSTSSAYRFPRGNNPHQWKLGAWAEATVPKLENVAHHYGDYIFYGELTAYLFEQTQVRTDQRLDYWIRHVPGTVLDYCDAKNCWRFRRWWSRRGPGWSAPASAPGSPRSGFSPHKSPTS